MTKDATSSRPRYNSTMTTKSFINHKPFSRLRWRLFSDFDEILVEEREESRVTGLLPFKNHPIATEPATLTGLTNLEIDIEDLVVKQSNDSAEEEWRYHAPTPLRVETEEGHPITVGDIVGRLHEYLNTHKNDIVEAINDIAGDDTVVEVVDGYGNAFLSFDKNQPLFFESLVSDYKMDNGQHRVSVSLFWEGDLGSTLEDFWKLRESLAR
jgi:hypothetical protein